VQGIAHFGLGVNAQGSSEAINVVEIAYDLDSVE